MSRPCIQAIGRLTRRENRSMAEHALTAFQIRLIANNFRGTKHEQPQNCNKHKHRKAHEYCSGSIICIALCKTRVADSVRCHIARRYGNYIVVVTFGLYNLPYGYYIPDRGSRQATAKLCCVDRARACSQFQGPIDNMTAFVPDSLVRHPPTCDRHRRVKAASHRLACHWANSHAEWRRLELLVFLCNTHVQFKTEHHKCNSEQHQYSKGD